ncbi:MAG: hypothetical protein CL678_08550 [Bdellovibrionaceae bacterium]|nr:hypothetical protein [Pseudobdellovibrionaceae bacterium]
MTEETDWKAALPDELKANPTINQTESVESLAKQLVDSQAYMGQAIRIPGSEAGEEAWQEFNGKLMEKVPTLMHKPKLDNPESMAQAYKQLGHPENATEYKIAERDVPTGVEINSEPIELFRKLAHDAGLNQSQFDKIVNGMTDDGVAKAEAGIQAHNDSHRDLQKEWGMATEQRMAVADRTRREFFPQYPEATELPADMIKGLYEMGSRLGTEATGLTADLGSQVVDRLAPADAQQQLWEIGKNKQHPYWNSSDPEHKLWVGVNGKYIKLISEAYPQM